MQPGDVMFHCLGTPHGSPANVSQQLRRTLYLGFLAEQPWRDFYSDASWSRALPAWGSPQVAARWLQMLRARQQLGLELPLDRDTLRFQGTHFEYVGEPRTPPRAWERHVEAIGRKEERSGRHRGAGRSVA
jgi:hypothetical protein